MALHSPILEYLRETLCRRAWGYLEPAALKDKWEKNVYSNGNPWPLLTFLKYCGGWGRVFPASASPRS